MIKHILANAVKVGNTIHLHGRDWLVMWVHVGPKVVEVRAKPKYSQIIERYTFPHEKSISLVETNLSQFKWGFFVTDPGNN